MTAFENPQYRPTSMGPSAALVLVNLIGGTAVLGSYVWGVWQFDDPATALWGDAPAIVRSSAVVTMLLAALGYLWMVWGHLLWQSEFSSIRLRGYDAAWLIVAIDATILLLSALWMPLTVAAIQRQSQMLRYVVFAVLWGVAGATMVLVWAEASMESSAPSWSHRLAIAGSLAFALQTVILDAIVWVMGFDPSGVAA